MSQQKKRSEPWRPGQLIRAAGDRPTFAVPPSVVIPVEVNDPYGSGKVMTLRSGRDDPLGWLHGHRHISDQQYEAGRLYQRDVEVSEGCLRGIDTTREKVDGGRSPDLMTHAQQDARRSRRNAEAAMGVILAPIAYDMIVSGLSNGQVALKKDGLYFGEGAKCAGGPLSGGYDDPLELRSQRANDRARTKYGRRHVDNIGVLFRSALDCLVIYYGLQARLAA